MATDIIKNSVRALGLAAALTCANAAQAAINIYSATLTGPNESPPNASPGTGSATVTIDTVANTMLVYVTFAGLQGTTTASHIHAPTAVPFAGTAGVATTVPTFAGFPLGVTSGTYNPSAFDLLATSTYNPAYVTANGGTVTGARNALLSAIASGQSYLNIHTTSFPGGEIRGFLVAVVPEPATWMMMLLGFGAIGLAVRRRQTSVASA
ncbi:MAG: CHRD domain-containing protein [Sphingomicrobium sp.]